MLKLRMMARVEMSSLLHRDFLGAHRYTTRGSMCVLRRPLHGAECLSSIVIRGNDLSPSLRYPFVYFAFAIGLKTRPITSTKNTCHYTDYAWIITDTGKKEYKRRKTDYKVQLKTGISNVHTLFRDCSDYYDGLCTYGCGCGSISAN